MNHAELDDLLRSYREGIERWQKSLVYEAVNLFKSVAARLKPEPETWLDPYTGEQHEYVALLDISEEPKQLRRSFTSKSITDKDELFFAIQVTFDQASEVYPMAQLRVPVAVRFRAGKPEFSLFDTQSQAARSPEQWNPDMSNFTEAVISEIEDFLRFDPFQGPRSPSSIGFL
jgi:hypothetical protein